MGVSRNKDELLTKTRNFERSVDRLGQRNSVVPVAQAAKAEMLATAAAAGLHPGSRIAGRPWRGVYIRNDGSNALGVGYAAPAHLVNNSTKAHVIATRGQRQRSRRQAVGLVNLFAGSSVIRSRRTGTAKGAKALHFGNTFAAYVRSPGTRGKRFFERSKPAVTAAGATVVHKQMAATLIDAFR